MNVVIEIPKTGDFDKINKLAKQVQELHIKWRPDLYVSVDEIIKKEEFEQRINEKEIYIAKLNDLIIGYIVFKIKEIDCNIIRYRKVLNIEAICVDKDSREKGVGTLLLDRAKEIAKENKCTDLYLSVNEENKNAIKVYEKYGFKVKNISYSMEI